MQPATFRNNTANQRYELVENDKVVAVAEYREAGNKVKMTHTQVNAEHEGKGHGSEIARQALDDLRTRGMQVIPACQFIASYIRKNNVYQDLLSPEDRDKAGMSQRRQSNR